jgi:hypothetical protein
LIDLFSWHDKEKTLEIIRSDLIEDHFDVERVVQTKRIVPHGTTEDQVIDGPVPLELWMKKIKALKYPSLFI